MNKLKLSIAVGDYDRIRPLMDGSVQIEGVDPVFMLLEPEEIFFRAFRHADFDICELSMSSFSVKTANGDCPYVGVPVFPSRAFRHNSIYIRTDRGIARPEDLKDKRIGVPEYQVTANVWTRAVLEDEHGVKPSDVTWIRGRPMYGSRTRRKAPRSPACWQMARLMPSSARAHRPASATVIRRSRGFIPIRRQPQPHGSAAHESSPLCTSSAFAAPWPSSIPGCRPRQ
jgi:4,5-dihydroxyphthalate decarboxylase